VAFATNLLIETADGVLSGTHSLIVASNEVAGAAAQLVAASRVKANLMSKTQERLEVAAKAVTEACKALVKLVRTISTKQVEEEDVDFKNMATLEETRDGAAGRNFAFGEGLGRGETSAGGNASCTQTRQTLIFLLFM
jgi:hypothetical protein